MVNSFESVRYLRFPVTPFEQNCSLIWCTQTREASIIDPGSSSKLLENAISEHQLSLKAIWLTHGHWDHAGGANYYRERYCVKVIGPQKEDEFLLNTLPEQAARFGLSQQTSPCTPDHWLEEGDVLTLGALNFDVLHCPGHTPGHVVFVEKMARKAWVGDVLFKGSVGRSDFPRSNGAHLIASIQNKLLPLGDDMEIFPGHGPSTFIGDERINNPFLR